MTSNQMKILRILALLLEQVGEIKKKSLQNFTNSNLQVNGNTKVHFMCSLHYIVDLTMSD